MVSGRGVAPFNRSQIIADIQLLMRRLRVSHCLSLLSKYGLPETRKIGKFHEEYLPGRLIAGSDHQLAALNSVLKTKYDNGSALLDKYSNLNDKDQFRLFISHSGTSKHQATLLKEELALGGLSCFVAGDDIASASEWLVEIVTQLEHMDGLVSLLNDQSVVSPTCNQEVGFALGAGVPVISVMKSVPPQGLVGQMQAIEWGEGESLKSVALDVIGWLMSLPDCGPRLTDCLVRQIVTASSPGQSFRIIGFCRKALKSSPYLMAGQIYELRKAARENAEIARFASGRGPELISALCDEFEEKARAV